MSESTRQPVERNRPKPATPASASVGEVDAPLLADGVAELAAPPNNSSSDGTQNRASQHNSVRMVSRIPTLNRRVLLARNNALGNHRVAQEMAGARSAQPFLRRETPLAEEGAPASEQQAAAFQTAAGAELKTDPATYLTPAVLDGTTLQRKIGHLSSTKDVIGQATDGDRPSGTLSAPGDATVMAVNAANQVGTIAAQAPVVKNAPASTEPSSPAGAVRANAAQIAGLSGIVGQVVAAAAPSGPPAAPDIPGVAALSNAISGAVPEARPEADATRTSLLAQNEANLSAVQETAGQIGGIQSAAGQIASLGVTFLSPLASAEDEAATAPEQPAEEKSVASLDPATEAAGEEQRATAEGMVGGLLSQVAGHALGVAALGTTVPDQIMPAADGAMATIDAAVQEQVSALSASIAQARTTAEGDAQAVRAKVSQSYQVTTGSISAATSAARQEIESAYEAALSAINEQETAQNQRIEALYTQGNSDYQAAGTLVGNEALAHGETRANTFMAGLVNEDDSLLDGPLTYNRGKARADAARQVAQGYRDAFIEEGKNQAAESQKRKPEDIEAVSETARQSREALKQQHAAALAGLSTGESQALDQAAQSHSSFLSSIDQALRGLLTSLGQQELSQSQTLRDAGEQQRVAIQQGARGTIASLQSGIAKSAAGLTESAQTLAGSLNNLPAPPIADLETSIVATRGQIEAGVGTLQAQSGQAIASAVETITQGAQSGTQSMAAMLQQISENITGMGGDFSTSMGGMASGAADSFSQQQQGYATNVRGTVSTTTQGFEQVKTNVASAFTAMSSSIETRFTQNITGLTAALRNAKGAMDAKINEEAEKAAAQVQPRWKTVAKWVLVIVVVLVVAFVIGPLLIGLGPIATVLVGALIGAVSGAVIQIGNNLIDGKTWHEGVVQAVVAGAIGGAIGGVGSLVMKGVGSTVLKLAGDVVFNVAGDIISKLVLGQPITVEGVLKGALMGLVISVGVMGIGAIGSKIKGFSVNTPEVKVDTPEVKVDTPEVKADTPEGGVKSDKGEAKVNDGVAKKPDKFVDLTNDKVRNHILEGDETDGGHRHGTGKSGKSEFPADWSDEKILHEVSDIATDPNATWEQQTGKLGAQYTKAGDPVRWKVTATHDGIDITVIVEPHGRGIVTGFPTNTPRNP